MRNKKFRSLLMSLSLSLSVLAGYGTTASAAEPAEVSTEEESIQAEAVSDAEENAEEADQLLADLTGTYQELWPVVLADEYRQLWLDDAAELVGEENAEQAVEKLTSMVTGELYGEEAAEAYADGNGVYNCEFTQDVETLEFAPGNVIRGFDASGKELFSHTYQFIGMEELRGLYTYRTDDADAGEFTYFCIAPDTMETTWHIELRYGSDADALGRYDAGEYAYWLAAGISTDCDQDDISNVIGLFCEENLSE